MIFSDRCSTDILVLAGETCEIEVAFLNINGRSGIFKNKKTTAGFPRSTRIYCKFKWVDKGKVKGSDGTYPSVIQLLSARSMRVGSMKLGEENLNAKNYPEGDNGERCMEQKEAEFVAVFFFSFQKVLVILLIFHIFCFEE